MAPPVTLPVRLPVTLPVRLPVTSPVIGPVMVTPLIVPPVMVTALAFCVDIVPGAVMLSTVYCVTLPALASTNLYAEPAVKKMSARPAESRMIGLVLGVEPAAVV